MHACILSAQVWLFYLLPKEDWERRKKRGRDAEEKCSQTHKRRKNPPAVCITLTKKAIPQTRNLFGGKLHPFQLSHDDDDNIIGTEKLVSSLKERFLDPH